MVTLCLRFLEGSAGSLEDGESGPRILISNEVFPMGIFPFLKQHNFRHAHVTDGLLLKCKDEQRASWFGEPPEPLSTEAQCLIC